MFQNPPQYRHLPHGAQCIQAAFSNKAQAESLLPDLWEPWPRHRGCCIAVSIVVSCLSAVTTLAQHGDAGTQAANTVPRAERSSRVHRSHWDRCLEMRDSCLTQEYAVYLNLLRFSNSLPFVLLHYEELFISLGRERAQWAHWTRTPNPELWEGH